MNVACLPAERSTEPAPASSGQADPFDSAVLLAEADHRIANHLALLMGYVRLKTADMDSQGRAPSLAAMHVLLDGVGAQIAAVARLHRALVSDSPPGPVDLGKRLHEVCAPFARGLAGAATVIEDFAPGCVVGPNEVLPLSQITAEIVTNALRRAYDGASPGRVVVSCRDDVGGGLRVEVVDSGCGLPVGSDPEVDGGLGLRLVRGLARKLGAQIALESATDGVRFCLTLPRPGPRLDPKAH